MHYEGLAGDPKRHRRKSEQEIKTMTKEKRCPFKASPTRICDQEICALWRFGHCALAAQVETQEEIKEVLESIRAVIVASESEND